MATERKPRRTSKLKLDHPAAPAEPQAPAEPEPGPAHDQPASAAQDQAEAKQPTEASADAAQGGAGEGKKKYPHKVSLYQDPELTDRMRGAILYTMPYEGPRTISEFINRLIEKELQRLETEYNNGEQFPGVGAKSFPRGRPMGS